MKPLKLNSKKQKNGKINILSCKGDLRKAFKLQFKGSKRSKVVCKKNWRCGKKGINSWSSIEIK
jgi:hypothetical protein